MATLSGFGKQGEIFVMLIEADLKQQIRAIFSTHLSMELPDDDADLLDTGIIDSLTMVDLLSHLETNYGFTVVMDELDIEYFRDLKSIAQYVQRSCK